MDSPSRHPLEHASHEHEHFPPSRVASLPLAAQARPREYARTRNRLEGAVTALRDGRRVGRGHLELTGYGRPLEF